VETVIDGSKLCKYAIHIPPSLVPQDSWFLFIRNHR
jgi:hypothetical protein